MTPIRLRDFERIVFFTGAGLSAESGIPTYRGQGGVWGQYRFQDYACQAAFERNPEKVWDFHEVRRERVAQATPCEAHRIIARTQMERPSTQVITQNIDGLLQRAGAPRVIELHGSLWRIRCDNEGLCRADESIPLPSRRCRCGAYWRPDIVWFGDQLDSQVMAEAVRALEQADLIVSVGTSGVVFPAADLPRIAIESGATSVEINLEDTPVSHLFQHRLRATASQALAAMAEATGR